ncbi:pupal cuticle protein-like [Diachasmimorpha longicaudata]|uniref:pupal cuticle protein-like n=1 Tax=Diachasmimorpha longicaudata TaxID=58733 RepID=UPI0030B88994
MYFPGLCKSLESGAVGAGIKVGCTLDGLRVARELHSDNHRSDILYGPAVLHFLEALTLKKYIFIVYQWNKRPPVAAQFGITMRTIIIAVAVVGIVSGQDLYFREPEKLKSESKNFGDTLGTYAVAYETEGGILQQEIGSRKYAGTPDEAQLIQGSVQYNAPDGTPISLSWTADEYGTQVSGSHLPTSPPIPPAIQRALDWISKQPTTEEPDYDNGEGRPAQVKASAPKAIASKDPKFRSQKKF